MKKIIFFIFIIFLTNSTPKAFFNKGNSNIGYWDSFSKLFDIKLDFSLINSNKSPIYELSAILTSKNELKFASSFSPQVDKNQVLCASIKFQDLMPKIGFILKKKSKW